MNFERSGWKSRFLEVAGIAKKGSIVWQENTTNAQIVCSSPKICDFDEKKASLGVRSPC